MDLDHDEPWHLFIVGDKLRCLDKWFSTFEITAPFCGPNQFHAPATAVMCKAIFSHFFPMMDSTNFPVPDLDL